MKNKNLKEGALDVGIQSYQTSSTSSNTSTNKKPTVMVKRQDLQKTMNDLKGVDADVVVTKESEDAVVKPKLKYLSDVMVGESNDISQPFTIKDKRYQMVRALTPNRERVMGVYSLDETDEDGNNVIYDVNEFETNIARKAMSEEDGDTANVIDEPADEVNPQSKADEIGGPSFIGFKHYIVNRKTGKARKFKTIEDLAKAQMTEDEQYMGIKDFKKYVDEVLFGAGKKQMKEVDVATTTTTSTTSPIQQKMISSAQKMMKLISEKIPSDVIQQIKLNHIAQREVILAFAGLVGVPNSEMQKIINGLKGMGKDATTTNSVNENSTSRAIIKTMKIKDIK